MSTILYPGWQEAKPAPAGRSDTTTAHRRSRSGTPHPSQIPPRDGRPAALPASPQPAGRAHEERGDDGTPAILTAPQAARTERKDRPWATFSMQARGAPQAGRRGCRELPELPRRRPGRVALPHRAAARRGPGRGARASSLVCTFCARALVLARFVVVHVETQLPAPWRTSRRRQPGSARDSYRTASVNADTLRRRQRLRPETPSA